MSAGDNKTLMQCKLDIKPEEVIVITQYVSPTRFRYISLEDLRANGRMVNHIESQLPGHCQSGNSGKIYQLAQYVILHYLPLNSEKYLRGQVIDAKENVYIVEVLDYGFLIQCKGNDLWPLPKNFRNIYIDIKYGGLSDVTSFSGKDWSEREVRMLHQKLEEALLLVFRAKKHNFGQLWIKSSQEQETLLNAANFMIDNQCALWDLKYMSDRSEEPPFNLKFVELNEVKIMPSKPIARIIRLVQMERIQLPLQSTSDPDPVEDQQLSRLTNAYNKHNTKKRYLTTPSKQPEKLQNLLRQHTMPTIPDSAKSLSVVKNQNESSVEKALYSDSCSGSNCSSDTFAASGVSANQRAILERKETKKIMTVLKTKQSNMPSKMKGESQIKINHSTHSSVINSDDKPTTSQPLSNLEKSKEKSSTKNKRSDLSNSFEELRMIFSHLNMESIKESQYKKATVDQPKAVLEKWNKEKLDRIIKEMSRTEYVKKTQGTPEMKSTANPVKKVTEQSSKLQMDVDRNNSLDKEKLERIYNQFLGFPIIKETQNKTKIKSEVKEKLLLAHSNGHVMPNNGTPETLFCEEIWMAMVELNQQNPWPMQRYAWSHLMRGNTLVLIDGIGTGRSWCYLPMLCSLVNGWMRRSSSRNKDTSSLGPLAIILTDSVGNSRLLSNHCNKLMKSNDLQVLAVINTHDHILFDVQLMLLNSCGILITTVSHMKQLFVDNKLNLIDQQRLKYFIVDDYDRMLSTVPDLLNESLQLLQNFTNSQLQLIIVAQRWHGRVFMQLVKRFNHNPLLLFGDFLVSAIYGNVKIDVVLRHSSKKTQQLIDYLNNLGGKSLRRHTVIFCKTREQLAGLQEALTTAGYECLGLGDAVHQQSQELLLVSDEDQGATLLPIRNFKLLVHYSLPATWSKFSHRFHAIIDNIANCLVTQEKPKDIVSYVMLDENSSYELPRLAKFLRSHDIKLDSHIDQLVTSCRQLTDQSRVFCTKLLTRGKCAQNSTCSMRHYTMDADFKGPHGALWEAGTELRCKLIKAYNPVHLAVMVESYKSSNCDTWKTTKDLSKLRKLCSSLNVHMNQEENRRVQQKLHISDICVISRGMGYQRIRILDLSDQRLITVQLLDESTELLKVKPVELFECAAKFKEIPPLTRDVRMCGLVPGSIGEGNWLPKSTNWVNEELQGLRDNQYLQLAVEFNMLGIVYVQEITVLQECPTMKTSVKIIQLRKELIRRKFGQQEEQNIKNLKLLHQEILEQQKLTFQKEMEKKNSIKEKLNNSAEDMDRKVKKDAEEIRLLKKEWQKEQQIDTLKNYEEETQKESGEQRLDAVNLGNESIDEFQNKRNRIMTPLLKDKVEEEFDKLDIDSQDSTDLIETLKLPTLTIKDKNDNTLNEVDDTYQEKNYPFKVNAVHENFSTDTDIFVATLLKDLQNDEPLIQDGAKQILKEMHADNNPVAKIKPRQIKSMERQQTKPNTMRKALSCASIEGNAVRPKVKWHQTLQQIELIFEQQVPQYELIHQGNILIYQLLETTPPQRCILNLLGEVRILSEKQHGYHLHVKLAKHNLILYWPTLLSSLSAQQHCRWLVYDMERGKLPQSEIGRIIWMRYMRGLCSSKSADDEEPRSSSDDEMSSSDED